MVFVVSGNVGIVIEFNVENVVIDVNDIVGFVFFV